MSRGQSRRDMLVTETECNHLALDYRVFFLLVRAFGKRASRGSSYRHVSTPAHCPQPFPQRALKKVSLAKSPEGRRGRHSLTYLWAGGRLVEVLHLAGVWH